MKLPITTRVRDSSSDRQRPTIVVLPLPNADQNPPYSSFLPFAVLLCYKYTAEEHCRSAITGPWGVCHPTAAEWDMTASAASSESTAVAGSTSNSAHRSAGFYSRHSGHGNDVSTLSLAIFVALGTSSLLSVAALSLA